LQVTFAPTMISASVELNTIPGSAVLRVDCRVPPGLGRETAERRLHEVLGDAAAGVDIAFFEEVAGNASRADSPLMDALRRWLGGVDPEAACVPTVSPGYSDSRTFREAFPECVAYGFFPQRAMNATEAAALVHAPDERIPTADLALAVDCYRAVAVDLLG
jgi:acetylornithine deacetylase/succinyl-diaminopimelate desuccinylase-like protein